MRNSLANGLRLHLLVPQSLAREQGCRILCWPAGGPSAREETCPGDSELFVHCDLKILLKQSLLCQPGHVLGLG